MKIDCLKNFFFSLLMVASCTQYRNTPLERALFFSGDNREELVAVLDHYKNEPLKLKAAHYLIENMIYHHSREEYFISPDGKKYRPDVLCFANGNEIEAHCDSLVNRGYRIESNIRKDISSIDSKFLIENIDMAFEVWQKPWAKDILFEDFCRYILPYRSQVEIISSLRKEMMERFLPLLDSAQVSTPLEACMVLNEKLKEIIRFGYTGSSLYPMIEESYQAGYSECTGMCNLGIFIMRAVGIPVAPESNTWPKMDRGHNWGVVFENGKSYSFGPGEGQPGDDHVRIFTEIPANKLAKVYRFQFDPVPLKSKFKDDGYITYLKNPLYMDVTTEYPDSTIDIKIRADKHISRTTSKLPVYLCVFNYYKWEPLAIGYRENRECFFENVIGDNIFMVADSPDGNTLRFISSPFHIDSQGKIKKLIPLPESKQSFTIPKLEQWPDQPHTLYYWNTDEDRFIPLTYQECTDTTQYYDNIPENALLWFSIPNRIYNQRIFMIEKDSLLIY